MNMRKLRSLVCVSAGIALLSWATYCFAQRVDANVLGCTDKNISLELAAEAAFQVGDTVDVGYSMGIMGESLIGTYKITSFTRRNVLNAQAIRTVINASQGMRVVVYPSTEQPLIDNLFSDKYGQKSTAVDVTNVQKSLQDLGYDPGQINGQPSKKTENAVKAFQKEAGLPVDGKITQSLADSLYQELNSFDRFNKKEQAGSSTKASAKNVTSPAKSNQTQGPKADFGDAFDDF